MAILGTPGVWTTGLDYTPMQKQAAVAVIAQAAGLVDASDFDGFVALLPTCQAALCSDDLVDIGYMLYVWGMRGHDITPLMTWCEGLDQAENEAISDLIVAEVPL